MKVSGLLRDACHFLSMSEVFRDLSSQFMDALDVLMRISDCPYLFVTAQLVKRVNLQSQHPNTFDYCCVLDIDLCCASFACCNFMWDTFIPYPYLAARVKYAAKTEVRIVRIARALRSISGTEGALHSGE